MIRRLLAYFGLFVLIFLAYAHYVSRAWVLIKINDTDIKASLPIALIALLIISLIIHWLLLGFRWLRHFKKHWQHSRMLKQSQKRGVALEQALQSALCQQWTEALKQLDYVLHYSQQPPHNQNDWLHLTKAYVYLMQGQFNQALDVCKNISIDTDDKHNKQIQQAILHLKHDVYQQQQNHAMVVTNLLAQQALSKPSQNSIQAICQAYANNHQYPELIEYVQRSRLLSQAQSDAWQTKAHHHQLMHYWCRGQVIAAQQYFDELPKSLKHAPELTSMQIRIHLYQHQFEQAQHLLFEALKSYPESSFLHELLPYTCHQRIELMNQALQELESLIERYPDVIALQIQLISVYEWLDRTIEADEICSKLLEQTITQQQADRTLLKRASHMSHTPGPHKS